MNFEFSRYMEVLIQTKFPGGLAAFAADGGCYTILPKTPHELLVYHPNLTIEFKNLLTQAVGALQLGVRFVTTRNFEGHEPAEIMTIIETKVQDIIKDLNLIDGVQIIFDGLLNVIAIADRKSTRALAETLMNRIHEVLPSCIRTCVVYGENEVAWFEYPQIAASLPEKKVALEVSTRTTVIGDDDLLNLKITLENAQTVDDFIASM